MRPARIAIIGGGPGGLMTAFRLEQISEIPIEITIFEASERTGGKIITPSFQSASVRYEAGAAEFYDYSHFGEDPLKQLIQELGLPICSMGGSACILNDQVIANLDDVAMQFGEVARRELVRFDRFSHDVLVPEAFYISDDPEGVIDSQATANSFEPLLNEFQDHNARRYVEVQIHSDLATEPNNTSVRYGLHNYLMNDPAYMSLYGIDGGNERLPQELVRRLQATIQTNCPVRSIVKTDLQKYQVTFECDRSGESCQEFDWVVIALPHNAIPSLEFPERLLDEAITRHWNRYHFPAHYLRITLLFKSRFWHRHLVDSFWMLDQFDGCCLYDESSRVPEPNMGVLGWLLAGDAAESRVNRSDEALIEAALDSLPSWLASGRWEFQEGRVHRWANAVNALPAGKHPLPHDQRHQPEPGRHPELMFVGDYLFDSTLNGVLDSADYVARWIAAELIRRRTADGCRSFFTKKPVHPEIH
jgi:monoamine oxidase